MIVLDTNVVYELMTSPPAPSVREWGNSEATGGLYLTTISIAEIELGLMGDFVVRALFPPQRPAWCRGLGPTDQQRGDTRVDFDRSAGFD